MTEICCPSSVGALVVNDAKEVVFVLVEMLPLLTLTPLCVLSMLRRRPVSVGCAGTGTGSAGAAEIPDVIDAATRLVADEAVAGRALVVGPKLKTRGIERIEEDGMLVVNDDEGDGEGRAVWECYAHDYDEVDTLVQRYVWLLNGVAKARGWFAWISDIWRVWRRT